ncbi:MAG TPA: CBS domain-containing protein [Candidatus Methanofastidiosa archaeon]|nr:CBS domain-containing protein [Candidatus Methanofastidiosa archaeon]
MKITGIVRPTEYIDGSVYATKPRQMLRSNKVIFVEKNGVFRGMIDRTTGLQITRSKSTLTALDIAKQPKYQTTPDDVVKHVAEKMIKYDTYIIPVSDGNRPVGYVGMSDIIAILLLDNELTSKMELGNVMRRYPIFVYSDDSIVKLWNIMEEIKFSGVPVVKETASRKDRYNKLVGYVSKKDLLNAGNVRKALEGTNNPPKVEKIMNRSPITLNQTDTVSIFVEKMIKHDISRIPIVNEAYGLEGIVGKMDVLKLLIEGN